MEVLKNIIMYSKRCQFHFLRCFRIIYDVAPTVVVFQIQISAVMAGATAAAVSPVLFVIIHSTTYHHQLQKHRFRGHPRRHWKIIRCPVVECARVSELYLRTIIATRCITIFLNPEHASIQTRHLAMDGE